MNKIISGLSMFKTCAIALLIAVFMPAFSGSSYAAVGQSYDSMVAVYGSPQSMPLNMAVSSAEMKKIQANNMAGEIKSYVFEINSFKMIALFNASDICYEMKTYGNASLPNPADLIGSSLAETSPVVINRVWLRSVTLKYGTGADAVIYRTFGLPGDFSAIAYSPALKP